MTVDQLSLNELGANEHLNEARAGLDQALRQLAEAARHLEAAHALRPRDRKGRPLHASALRLWGALTAINTATRSLRTAHTTCTAFIDQTQEAS